MPIPSIARYQNILYTSNTDLWSSLKPVVAHYTGSGLPPSSQNPTPDLQRCITVRVDPHVNPQHIKKLKHFVYVSLSYWCGMHFTGDLSLNHVIITSHGLSCCLPKIPDNPTLLTGGPIIKSPKIIFSLFGWYHLGSLGIYFDKMDPNFEKKNDQKCSVGGANGNFTPFC
jgi:hypothetical protein